MDAVSYVFNPYFELVQGAPFDEVAYVRHLVAEFEAAQGIQALTIRYSAQVQRVFSVDPATKERFFSVFRNLSHLEILTLRKCTTLDRELWNAVCVHAGTIRNLSVEDLEKVPEGLPAFGELEYFRLQNFNDGTRKLLDVGLRF